MTARQAKVAIYGAGAMGTVLGALLIKGGLSNIQLITRNQAHVDSLNKHGANIVCPAVKKCFCVQVAAKTPLQMQGKYDVVFLMTKQRHNQEILRALLPYLHENSVVCTTQNGLPEQSVCDVIGAARTYGGVASFGATFLKAGEVALTSKPSAMRMQVSGYQNDGEKTQLLLDVLSYAQKALKSECFAYETKNLAGARWSKLSLNAAFSGLSVVTGQTFGKIAKGRKSQKIALEILRECMFVAKANGVTMEKMQGYDMQKLLMDRGFFQTQLILTLLPFAMKKHAKLVSGMLKDVEQGKKCEIDFINGVVVNAGKRANVQTPYCARLVELVHGIENGLYEITPKNLHFFTE